MDIPYPQRKEIEYFLRENLPVGASDQDIPAERLQSVRFRAYFLRLKDRQAPFERERFDGRGREDSLPSLRLVRLNDDARDAVSLPDYFFQRRHRKPRRAGIDDFHKYPLLSPAVRGRKKRAAETVETFPFTPFLYRPKRAKKPFACKILCSPCRS